MHSEVTRRNGHETGIARECGVALITSVLVMVLVAATAIASLSNSEEDLKAGGRSRSVMSSLYAAEAGIQFAKGRIQAPRDLSAFSFVLGPATVESRSRGEASPQALIESGLGKPPPGYAINIGSGFANETFEINVTAESSTIPTTEIEVKVGVLIANSGNY